MPDYRRRPLKATEFRAAVNRFRQVWTGSVITSTHRSEDHNRAVGGGDTSKHLLFPMTPIACDLDWPDAGPIERGDETALAMEHDAKILGMRALYHDGHLHLQGLPKGPIPEGYDPV